MTAAVHLILRVMSLIGIGYWTVVLARRSERWRVLVTGHWMLMFLLSVAWPGKRDPLWMTVYALVLAVMAHVVPLYDKRRAAFRQERLVEAEKTRLRRQFPQVTTEERLQLAAEANLRWDAELVRRIEDGGQGFSREEIFYQALELFTILGLTPNAGADS